MHHIEIARVVTRSLHFRRVGRALTMALLGACGLGCGPELTEPAEADVSGSWFAAGPAADLMDIRISLMQTANGAITGTYTATGPDGADFCPSVPPCSLAGDLTGSHTVLQVFFDLETAGRFTGQLTDGSVLRGALERGERADPVEFVAVPEPLL